MRKPSAEELGKRVFEYTSRNRWPDVRRPRTWEQLPASDKTWMIGVGIAVADYVAETNGGWTL